MAEQTLNPPLQAPACLCEAGHGQQKLSWLEEQEHFSLQTHPTNPLTVQRQQTPIDFTDPPTSERHKAIWNTNAGPRTPPARPVSFH